MKHHTYGTAPAPLSPAVRAGDFIYASGQIPVGADGMIVAGGIEAQTRQVFANLQAALALAGAGLENVVKTTVWLADRADFAAFNRIYAEFFPHHPPARSTIEARMMLDVAVEIEAVAYLPAEI